MIVRIKDRDVTLKKSYRSMIVYESITGSVFQPKNLTDMLTYFYSVIISSDKDLVFTFDEFIDWLDGSNPSLLDDFTSWVTEVGQTEDDITKGQKKRTRKKTVEQTGK